MIDSTKISIGARVWDWMTSALAFCIRQLFDWPGFILLALPLMIAGGAFRHGNFLLGVPLAVGWFVAVCWLTKILGERDVRLAAGVFLFCVLYGSMGFLGGWQGQ
ncbi:MAG: hypothetical protein ABI790_05200 [Betaproteobacteria bacterium]